MMDPCFELRDADSAGRVGELTVPRQDVTVTTPALLPVVNPNIRTIPPAELESRFGAQILITNAYIIHSNTDLKEQALEQGLHDWLDFSGAIMTDSGSFQLSEYGEISVTTEEILTFQREIGADIGTPVDIPTPPDVEREQAITELETTLDRLERAGDLETGDMLVSAPVQGSTYPELRERAGRKTAETGLDIFPIGAVVPLLEAYRFDDMIDVIVAAKRGLGPAAPVHLFGAGHPMMFALAAAAGCDLFDSAAYALYARDDRYLTVRGTKQLDDLTFLPCSCPICTEHEAPTLRALPDDEREQALAAHNLHVSFAEMRRVRQAIRQGELLELVEARARSHPAVLDGYRQLLSYREYLEASDPVTKAPFFYLSAESADRPEVHRYHERLDRFDIGDELLLTEGEPHQGYAECWRVIPPFGPVPNALSQTYPLTAERPDKRDQKACERAAEGIASLASANPQTAITLAHEDWPDTALARLPDEIDTYNLASAE